MAEAVPCPNSGLTLPLDLHFIASGRALSFIEDYVRSEVLPTYGNTHTLASKTGAHGPSNTQAAPAVLTCW